MASFETTVFCRYDIPQRPMAVLNRASWDAGDLVFQGVQCWIVPNDNSELLHCSEVAVFCLCRRQRTGTATSTMIEAMVLNP